MESPIVISKLSKILFEVEKDKALNVVVSFDTEIIEKYLHKISKSIEGIEKILRKKLDPFDHGRG